MPSFSCDGCGDVIKKPKLDSHSMRCRASVTCLDCSTTFNGPASWKPHTTCISEAQKYQKSLYQAPKNKKPNNNNSNNHDQIHSKTTVPASVPLGKQPTSCVAPAHVAVSHGPATLPPPPAQHSHPDQASEKEKRAKKDKKRKSHDRLPAPCLAQEKGADPEILPSDTTTSHPAHANTNEEQKRIKKKLKSNHANTGLGPGQKTDKPVSPPSENTPPHPDQAGPKEPKEKQSKKKDKKQKSLDQTSGLVQSETTDEPVVPRSENMRGGDTESAQRTERKKEKRRKKEKKREAHDRTSALVGPETAAVKAVVQPSEPAPSGGGDREPGRRKETKKKREKKDKKRKLLAGDQPLMSHTPSSATADVALTKKQKLG